MKRYLEGKGRAFFSLLFVIVLCLFRLLLKRNSSSTTFQCTMISPYRTVENNICVVELHRVIESYANTQLTETNCNMTIVAGGGGLKRRPNP